MSLTKVTYAMIEGAPINIQDYGAVGDGSTDDTAAILLALNALTDNSSLVFPVGNYLIDSALSKTLTSLNNVKIIGLGATITYGVDQTSQAFMVKFSSCENIEITGLTINGDAFIASLFYFDTCERVNVHHNRFEKLWNGTTAQLADGMAIYAEKSYQVSICNNQFYRVNRGVVFDESSTTTSNVEINDNDFYEMGFGCITLPHKNVNCIGNTMTYCSLGPFERTWNTYTRADMRDDAWVPTVNNPSMYGGSKGPAINAGAGLYNVANGWYPFPENVNCSNNVIKYAAEYGIGFEGARYLDAINFAGPNINITISNNIIEQTGITAIFITAVKGANISNNIIKNPCFNSTSDPAILLVARNVSATFSGESLANRQLNGVYNAIISNNTVIDTVGNLAFSIYAGPGNTPGAFTDNMFTDNLFEMAKADCKGIIVTQDPSVSNDTGVIHIINNWHTNDAGSVFPYVFFENFNPVSSIISGNHAYQMGGSTFGYIDYTKSSDFKYVSGTPEFNSAIASTSIPQNPGGTIAYIKSKDATTGSQPYALLNFISSNVNGASSAFIGSKGQGAAGVGAPATLVFGQQVNNTTWREVTFIDTSGNLIPAIDNTFSLGSSGNRWSVVYAATGSINTSDEREKQDIKDLSDAERQVAIAIKGLIKSFRFKDAVEKKGDKARIHFGVMAQQVAEAFKIVGLNPDDYALFCYDEWKDDEAIGLKAGNRYGIRYDELLAFVISAL